MGPPDRRDNPVDVAKQRLEAPITHYSMRSGFCEMLGRTGTRSRRGSWSGALCMHSQALWRMLRLRWRRFQAQGYYCASRAYQRPSSVQSDNPVVVIMVLLEALDEQTQARIMPTLLKKNPFRQQLRVHSLIVLNAARSYRHVLHCKKQAPRRQGISTI